MPVDKKEYNEELRNPTPHFQNEQSYKDMLLGRAIHSVLITIKDREICIIPTYKIKWLHSYLDVMRLQVFEHTGKIPNSEENFGRAVQSFDSGFVLYTVRNGWLEQTRKNKISDEDSMSLLTALIKPDLYSMTTCSWRYGYFWDEIEINGTIYRVERAEDEGYEDCDGERGLKSHGVFAVGVAVSVVIDMIYKGIPIVSMSNLSSAFQEDFQNGLIEHLYDLIDYNLLTKILAGTSRINKTLDESLPSVALAFLEVISELAEISVKKAIDDMRENIKARLNETRTD